MSSSFHENGKYKYNFKSEMIAEEMHNIYNTFSLQR